MTTGDFSSRMDRSSALPLWAQLHADLVRRIAAGEFAEEFPGEHALTASYGLSRHTVREALRRLRNDGALVAERGRATRLADVPAIEQPLGALYSLFRAVEANGVTQHSIVRALDLRTEPAAASTLDLSPDAPLVYLERLRMADDLPLALDSVWLPADVAEPLLSADFTHTALYIELETRCGIRLTGGQGGHHGRGARHPPRPTCSAWTNARPPSRSDGWDACIRAQRSCGTHSFVVTGSPSVLASPPARDTRSRLRDCWQ